MSVDIPAFGMGQDVPEHVKEQIREDDGEHAPLLRDYSDADLGVLKFYEANHANQTLELTTALLETYASTEARTYEASMWEMFMAVGELTDESDPDVDDKQILHAIQSAEAARANGEPRWMQAVVLVHDTGKVLATNLLPDREALPQWAVVGDTYPVGAGFDRKAIVLSEYFYPQAPDPDSEDPMRRQGWNGNPDVNNPKYNTELGIYEPGIGLDKLILSFGHDEYLARVLEEGETGLPPEAIAMVRFHSAYPIHTARGYQQLLAPGDETTIKHVMDFNPYDLYSKAEVKPDVDELLPYYKALIEEFFSKPLRW